MDVPTSACIMLLQMQKMKVYAALPWVMTVDHESPPHQAATPPDYAKTQAPRGPGDNASPLASAPILPSRISVWQTYNHIDSASACFHLTDRLDVSHSAAAHWPTQASSVSRRYLGTSGRRRFGILQGCFAHGDGILREVWSCHVSRRLLMKH